MVTINAKPFFLLLCLFNLVYLKDEILNPKGSFILHGEDNDIFHIKLKKDDKTYADYINIMLNSSLTVQNPMIYISTEKNCEENRTFVGIQLVEPIYTFFRRSQIQDDFYICIKQRTAKIPYEIALENANEVTLPYDCQASYYISDSSIKNMSFSFQNYTESTTDKNVTFWVKGQNITNAEIEDSNNYQKEQYDHGYVFHGGFDGGKKVLTIESNVGCYITIGSSIITQGKAKTIQENANEIMVASYSEVCFPVKYEREFSFITGKIFTNKGHYRFRDQDGQIIKPGGEEIENDITNGIINVPKLLGYLDYKTGSFCISNIKDENKLIILSLKITKDGALPLFYPPLTPGELQNHYLAKDQMAIFYGSKPEDDAVEANFNVKFLKGFPDMYFDTCTTFPNCKYTNDSLQDLVNPYPANRVALYSYYFGEKIPKNYTPISSFQPIIIIYCGEGYVEEGFGESMYCEFQTSYFTNMEKVYLPPDNTFSQYLYYDENDKYTINLINEDADKIYLDMMLFSGDSDLILPNFVGTANKYYLSNKIFYSIHLGDKKPNFLDFEVKANNKTFYMIQYKLLKSYDNDDVNTIASGINYITSKLYDESNQATKHIQLLNFKPEHGLPYLVTFYSPNCLFDVVWENHKKNNNQTITSNKSVSQFIIDEQSTEDEKFNFYYTIQKDVYSQYPTKFCMVYAAGLELSLSLDKWNRRAITLSEGIPHRYTYNNKNPLMFYSYQISDHSQPLVLDFNLFDNYYFDIHIYINNNKAKDATIYRNSQIIFKVKELNDYCSRRGNQFEVCSVDVRIKMHEITKNIAMEFKIYQVDSNPFYLEKNVVTNDVVNGNLPKHYYFDIIKDEYGDITLDFKRGSGFIYVSIEKQNLDKPMNNPDWRGLYHFPTNIEESLKFVTYGKKIVINKEDTDKCIDGCYVLITIVSNIRYYGILDDPDTPFRMSINPKIIKTGDNIPKVRINVNNFIVGDIIPSKDPQKQYDYYSIILPYESEKIIFDWQADGPSLLINIGSERPTKEKNHFIYNLLGSDIVYQITKDQIKKKLGVDNVQIKELELTIGIYSDIIDSIDSSPYAFKIFLPPITTPEYVGEIIHIRSDQKVQCVPFKHKNKNICLFAAIADDTDIHRNLVIYPRSQDDSKVTIYGKNEKAEKVELNDPKSLETYLNEVFDNKQYKENKTYAYIENVQKSDSYFFITVVEHDDIIIEVLSSTFTFYNNMVFYPNPSTAQIFAIGSNNINLKFSTSKDLLLNIVCVSGIGQFRWSDKGDKDSYYLNKYEDRLTLTTGTDNEGHKLDSLNALSSITGMSEEYKGGFIFYITYYPRGSVDQLKKNRVTEIQYRTVKMPLNFYVPVTFKNSWTINFIFYNMNLKGNKNLGYNSNLFNIWGKVISDKTASKARYDSKQRPSYDTSCIKGEFDSIFGTLYVDSNYTNKITEDQEIPNIYFSIEMANNAKFDFDSLGFEINIFSDTAGGNISAQEQLLISGKLSDSSDNKIVYILKCNKDKKYMKIEYTANSKFTQFALSNNPGNTSNDDYKDLEINEYGGVSILTMYLDDNTFPKNEEIYFTVFTTVNLKPELSHFSFQYFSSNIKPSIPQILSKNDSMIKVNAVGKDYKITFKKYPIEDTSYYIKAYYQDGFNKEEKIDTIAISESPGEIFQINEPNLDQDGNIIFDMSTYKGISYIKVMALIKTIGYKEFYLYTPEFVNTQNIPEPDSTSNKDDGNNGSSGDNKKDKDLILYISIGVGSAFVVIIIILIVFVTLYKKKNNDLAKQVNKISFVQSGAQERESGDDLLLGKDD